MTRPAPTMAALSAGLVAFALPLLYSPNLIAGAWSPRYTMVVVLGVVGLALLAGVAWIDRRPPVLLGAGFLGWAAVCTALSPNRLLAFWGYWVFGTGLLFIAGLTAAYVLGRLAAGRDGRRLIERGLLAAGVINATVALAQAAFDLSRSEIGLSHGRAPGLLGNPIYLAALLAGCFWLIARRSVDGSWRTVLPMAALFAAGIQVSGGRLPFGLSILGVLLVALLRWRAALAIAVAGIIGFAGAGFVASSTGATTASSRAATTDTAVIGGGIKARTEMWVVSRHAVADRPILGWGPSRFQAATSRYRTDDFARAEAPGALYADAHNLFVEYAVTIGLVGVAILVLWMAAAFRDAREAPALAFFAAGVLLSHLFEPQSPAVTPLAFLALGAAGPALGGLPRFARVGAAVLALPGAAVAAALLAGFFLLEVARLDFTEPQARTADRLLPWAEASEQRARIALLRAGERREPAQLQLALRFREEAVAVDPANPILMMALANSQLLVGQRAEAIETLHRVLFYNPTSTAALNALGDLALKDGRTGEGLRQLRRSLTLNPNQPGLVEVVRRAEAAAPG